MRIKRTRRSFVRVGVKVFDGSGELATAMYYDDKGRIVQQRSINQIGGHDYVYSQHDFTGNILQTLKEHYKEGFTVPTTERYTYSYDHAGRLINTTHQINQKDPVLLSSNIYDELGRLVKKQRHNQQDLEEFEYNIRNWITRIKSGDFEQKLYYNVNLPVNTTPCFNGNIAANSWTYNGTTNMYRYRYDGLSRLTYSSLNGDTYFEEEFRYDKHGNITSLYRGNKTTWLDALTLRYEGNQLKNVFDESANQNRYGVKEYRKLEQGNQNPARDEFFYDANGNLIADSDREIVTIRYNLLNLPDTVQFQNGNQIINHYAADGRKLCTRYFTLTNPVMVPMGEIRQWQFEDLVIDETATYYVDNFEYTLFKDPDISVQADFLSLTRLHNAEGYISNLPVSSSANQPTYCYYRKDHLGNNREVWQAPVVGKNSTTPASTIQRTQYYPSGLPFESLTGDNPERQPYKYNGKEFVTMHGYDMYDYGARGYYVAIMRFTTLDPLAEKYYSVSPYAYCLNNPVNAIDPNGEEVYMLFYTNNDARFKSAAETRQREIESMEGFDKTKDHVYIQELGDLGTLGNRVDAMIKDATDNGYGLTVETSFWSHSGPEHGPRSDIKTSGDYAVTDGGQNQMTGEGWSQVNWNYDSNNSLAAFYGCNSVGFSQRYLDYQLDVAFTAGQGGGAGPSYNTGTFDAVSGWKSFGAFSTSKNIYYGTRVDGAFYGPTVHSRRLGVDNDFIIRGNASIIKGRVQHVVP